MSDISWADYYEHLSDQCRDAGIPIYVGLELTPLCNFNCEMCYIHISREEQERRSSLLSADRWIEIAKQAYEMGTLSLTLSGGEVFTRPDFRYIYETLADIGFMITIYSNGYLINDSVIQWLSERPPHRVRVSVYGASDETYKAVTGIPDGYTVVKRNIEKMLATGISVGITMTVVKNNENDILAVEQFAESLEIPMTASRGLIKPLPGIDRNIEKMRTSVLRGQREMTADECYMPRESEAFSMCRALGRSCWVTWDGYVQLCAAMYAVREQVTDLRNNWEVLNQRLKNLSVPNECTKCRYWKYCHQCPASILSETGSPERINEECCLMAIQRYECYNRTEE